MAKNQIDPLQVKIQKSLNFGEFVSYGRCRYFIEELEGVKAKIDEIASSDPSRASRLFEIFMVGCHEKCDELDDSGGDLGMFFDELMIGWIISRQDAGDSSQEIIKDFIKWQNRDKYGLCYHSDKRIAKHLISAVLHELVAHHFEIFKKAFEPFALEPKKVIFDYPKEVFLPLGKLKEIFIERKDAKGYLDLMQSILMAPNDYEELANIYIAKNKYEQALEMVENGLSISKSRDWRNQSSYSLEGMKRDILGKLGKSGEALELAWQNFQKSPTLYSYEEVIEFAPKTEKKKWHDEMIALASKGKLRCFIEICTETKEWDLVAQRIIESKDEELSDLSHFVTEKPAKALEKKSPLASAMLYVAMGRRIVDEGKSKYYDASIDNFKIARKLYLQVGESKTWEKIVAQIESKHHRKTSFINDFRDIAEGKPKAKTIDEKRNDMILNFSKNKFFKEK